MVCHQNFFICGTKSTIWKRSNKKKTQQCACRVILSEAVDGCICFTRKIQHGSDWERSRPQGPKNVHNFSMTMRPLSLACGHGTEMFLILKKYFWPDYSPIFSYMTVQRNVSRFYTRSICSWNLFQPLGLNDVHHRTGANKIFRKTKETPNLA